MKKIIRKEVLRKRDEIPLEVRFQKDALIKKTLFSLSEFTKAKTLLIYASFRSEVETLSIIKDSLMTGKRIALPKVDREKHMLKLYEIKDIFELKSGYMGIPEPFLPEERLVNLNEIDIVIIPGAAFDYSGNRLGYGEGYYDILLSGRKRRMTVIALAYEEQIVDSIPSEDHDVKVDIIVTDKRVITK